MSSASCKDSAGKCQHCQQLEERVDQQAEIIDELRDELAQLKEDHADHVEETARERAEDRKRLTEVEQAVEEGGSGDETPTPEASETAKTDPLTPIERLSEGDRQEVAANVTPSVERAVCLFENLPEWGMSTPKGITLRPADNPKKLLEAARDESLAWQQYYRAAEALERLSKGSITFFTHQKHGKMVCLHADSELHERRIAAKTDHSQPSLVAGD